MIGSPRAQPDESLEGEPIIDLIFQVRVRLNPKTILQKQSLQSHQRWMGPMRVFRLAGGIICSPEIGEAPSLQLDRHARETAGCGPIRRIVAIRFPKRWALYRIP
jgi:hypothetical protein